MTVTVPDTAIGPTGWSLTPGTRLLWRGDGSFELERATDGVVVAGLDRAVAMHLARRVVPPPAGTVAAGARTLAVASDAADVEALHRLRELGYVRAHPPGATDADPVAPTASVTPPPGRLPGRPVTTAARRDAVVVVHGGTRAAAYLGALLAVSGVGHVSFTAGAAVRRRDLLPGGLGPDDEGRRFATAAAEVVLRTAAGTDVRAPAAEPDLVVVCADAPVEPELRDLLHRRQRTHLPVHLDASRAEVGPLVVPGVTPCLRCADLFRLDHDPAWTLLAVQLLTAAATAPPSDPGLAARAAGLAASVALGYLDGRTGDDAVSGSWELRPDSPLPRRRARLAHPECDCRAAWGEHREDVAQVW